MDRDSITLSEATDVQLFDELKERYFISVFIGEKEFVQEGGEGTLFNIAKGASLTETIGMLERAKLSVMMAGEDSWGDAPDEGN